MQKNLIIAILGFLISCNQSDIQVKEDFNVASFITDSELKMKNFIEFAKKNKVKFNDSNEIELLLSEYNGKNADSTQLNYLIFL